LSEAEQDVDEDVQEDDADEQPELDDDEIADISSVADEIEDETSPDTDDDQEESDDAGLDSPGTESLTEGDRTTPGDIYCNGLGMLAAVGRTQYGTADESERSELVEEYGDIARDLEIDQYVDELLEQQGGIDELSPGQALLATTMMWGGMVAMDDPEMLEGLGGESDA
jgi:hypothetical protein